jgi:hypothetical protein
MEILKSGFGCSDEDLYSAFLFDLQVRYALGLRDFASGQFELRTLYNFRHRPNPPPVDWRVDAARPGECCTPAGWESPARNSR